MIKKLLKIDDCKFHFPNSKGDRYYLIEIKDGKVYCGNHWKEVKLYSDGTTDLISICEMLIAHKEKYDEH